MLMTLLLSLLIIAFCIEPVKASVKVYVRANGSIEPPAASLSTVDNVTYTLTASVSGSLVIQRNNIVLDGAGYSVQGGGSGNGVDLSHTVNVTVKNMTIDDFDTGIHLDSPSNDSVYGNDVTNNDIGLYLFSSSGCTISGNNVTNNSGYGIWLYYSSNCTFSGNNIARSVYDIVLDSSFDNTFYHNNFDGNSPVSTTNSVNVWSDGYPSGGTYWKGYVVADLKNGLYQDETGSDGICDQPYVIDTENTDRYPLMGSFITFDAGTWNGTSRNVDFTSNSTISDLRILVPQKTIGFNVTGPESTRGFCRVAIPNMIVNELWRGNYTVLSNEEPLIFRNWTDTASTYIYVDYTHSSHEITIIPELLPEAILPLLIISSTLATIIAKARTHRKSTTQLSRSSLQERMC